MRRVIVVSLLGFAALGSGAPKASAWWTLDSHHCYVKIRCKQPNAFSPFCCEGVPGSSPMPGCDYGGSPEGYVGELPAPVLDQPAAPPVNGGPTASSPITVPGRNIQPFVSGAQPLPAWGAGMANPPGAPGYYPGFIGYGPGNGPVNYPGSTPYGPVNGYNAPPNYPGFIGYGPANAFGR